MDLDSKLNGESIAHDAAITIFYAKMLQMMECAFTTDFVRRIPATLQPIWTHLDEVRNKLSTSSSATDFRCTTLEQQVQYLTNQLATTTIA